MTLDVNYILEKSRANGPGIRYTIWVQGCSIHCPGCSNTDTWEFGIGKQYPIDTLVQEILSVEGLDGVTITGGEPLDQYGATLDLCSKLHGRLSVFLTTGYTISSLLEKNYGDILNSLDIICTGPYLELEKCSGYWKGSLNQRIHFLSRLGMDQLRMPVILKEMIVGMNGDTLKTGFSS